MSAAFWRAHALWPFVAYVAAMVALTAGGLDIGIAQRWFHDATAGGWIGHDAWWAESLLHDGGAILVRVIGGGALLGLLASFLFARLAAWRRAALYLVLAMALANGLVGLLKHVTNVDCPWDLALFGGRFPYVDLIADRPDELRHAACFPGAHAASGFALLAFYFVLRDVAPRKAGLGLAIGLGTGIVFGFAQEARGAHFLSHDLTSAAIAWCVCLALYATAQSLSTTLPALRPASRYSTASAADSRPTNGVGSTSARSSPR